MANELTRPTLLAVNAFDATQEYKFGFAMYGATGSQIVANKLVIKTQDNNTTVYEQKQETFKFEHILPAGTLKNNTYYNAVISVFDSEGNESPTSIPVQFWCYTTPVIAFTNIPVTKIINNASFTFSFTYTQTEGEKLNSYVVNLYDSSEVLLATSSSIYVENGTPPFSGSYLFTGFENSTEYFVEVIATTINGTIISTGIESFTVQYEHPDIFAIVELVNNCDEGYITVKSNFVLIKGESNPDPPIYINDKEVDLTNPEHWVEWNEGYSINGNFLTRVWFRNPTPYKEIIKFSNAQGQTISIRYMEGYENIDAPEMTAYIEIYVTSIEEFEYYAFSNYISILPAEDYYCAWIRRINNIYQLEFHPVTKT